MTVRLSLFLLLSACSSLPQGVPLDATEAREAWLQAGLPEPRCAPPTWAEVSIEEFNDRCPLRTCAEDMRPGSMCALSCTVGIPEQPTALYAGPPSSWFVQYPIEVTQAHETYHVWADCTLGDMDYNHTNPMVWKDAIRNFEVLDR